MTTRLLAAPHDGHVDGPAGLDGVEGVVEVVDAVEGSIADGDEEVALGKPGGVGGAAVLDAPHEQAVAIGQAHGPPEPAGDGRRGQPDPERDPLAGAALGEGIEAGLEVLCSLLVQRIAEPIEIICGYRSPGTNEMLRGRSNRSGVARHSQHTLGKAIDFYIPGVPLEKLRETAMRLQGGGVGYYPTSGSPFVHLDVGNVRAWPRMTREQLVKLFPDGRTVHLPTDGTPCPATSWRRPTSSAAIAPWPRRRSAASWPRCSAATRTPKRPTTTPPLAKRRCSARRDRQI